MRDLLQNLSNGAAQVDASATWPAEQFTWLAHAGVLQWVIPTEFAGLACSERELLSGYIDLAAACLTTTFILTQRNGACQRIAGSQNAELKAELQDHHAAVHAGRVVDRALAGLPCLWYDAATRRCRHHEHRPTTCRDFEINSSFCQFARRKVETEGDGTTT